MRCGRRQESGLLARVRNGWLHGCTGGQNTWCVPNWLLNRQRVWRRQGTMCSLPVYYYYYYYYYVGVVWITWCILEFYTPLKSLERLKLETSKFVRKLARWSISLVMTEYPTAGRGQGHVIHFYILGPKPYLWSGWSYTFRIWFADWTYTVLSLHVLKFCSVGRIQGHVTF